VPEGFYENQVLPRCVNLLLGGKQFSDIRRRVARGLSGQVLEVGFGSGLNVPHYPAEVERVRAVDPATVGRQLARKRLAAATAPVEFIGTDGRELPLESETIDHVLVTWTLCTIPDVESALAEMLRVLRPGGQLHFAEHGRSPDPSVAKWQDRLTPLQRRVAGGCHLNRSVARLVEGAGFTVTHLDNYYMRGPRPMGYMFEGLATKPA
jgi:ubiquinone/menaquinone biosynthesis C-methylase UbiE